MTDDPRATYLAGEGGGEGIDSAERAALDRIRGHLADESIWTPPPSDGQFRLLAAATAEAGGITIEPTPPVRPVARPPVTAAHEPEPEPGPEPVVDELAARRNGRGRRSTWFGAGALVAAAAVAIGFITVDRLNPADEPEFELAITAIYDLNATELDPDATGTVDIKPTVAGVELVLWLEGLDNTEGGDYYSAWLMGDGEAIPLGSFHWRAGGVPIVLWSGVDDPAYNRFMITRQTQGDGGFRSDQVVMTADVPDLTADE